MKFVAAVRSTISAWINAHKITLLVWSAIFLALFISTSISRSEHAAVIARLSSSDSSVRDAETLDLARSGRLSEELLSTEDPTGEADSRQNVRSTVIRNQAGQSIIRVAPQLTPQQAFATLYGLQKDTVVAPNAVIGLTTLGESNRANLKTLIAGLGDGDPDVRTAATDALSAIGGSDVAALVAQQVKVDAAQDAALATLTALGKPAVPYLTSFLLDSRSPEALRESTASALGTIGAPEAAPALESAATTAPPSPELRRVCLTALASIVLTTIPAADANASLAQPTSSPVETAEAAAESPILISSLLDQNDDSFARSREALALGRIATPAATDALVKSLASLDLKIAGSALSGVESSGPATAPALAAAMRSRIQSVRVASATALGVIGTREALSDLAPALSDPSAEVRRAAVAGLGRGRNPAAIPLLMASLSDTDGDVAATASSALHDLGSPAVQPLVDALSTSDPQSTRPFFASQALVTDGQAAIPALTAAADSSSTQKKVWIAVTLGAMHDPAAVPELQALAGESDARVAWAANQALSQYKGDG